MITRDYLIYTTSYITALNFSLSLLILSYNYISECVLMCIRIHWIHIFFSVKSWDYTLLCKKYVWWKNRKKTTIDLKNTKNLVSSKVVSSKKWGNFDFFSMDFKKIFLIFAQTYFYNRNVFLSCTTSCIHPLVVEPINFLTTTRYSTQKIFVHPSLVAAWCHTPKKMYAFITL